MGNKNTITSYKKYPLTLLLRNQVLILSKSTTFPHLPKPNQANCAKSLLIRYNQGLKSGTHGRTWSEFEKIITLHKIQIDSCSLAQSDI